MGKSPVHRSTGLAFCIALSGLLGGAAAWYPANEYYNEARAYSVTKARNPDLTPEESAAVRKAEKTQRLTDIAIFVGLWGLGACALVGLTTGLAGGGVVRGIGGLIVGGLLGGFFGAAGGVIGKILSDRFRIEPILTEVEKLTRTFAFQFVAFALFALAVTLIIGLFTNGKMNWAKGIGAGLVAAVISNPVYLAIVSLMFPIAPTYNFVPFDSGCRFVWFAVPAFLVTFAVTWLAVEPVSHTIPATAET